MSHEEISQLIAFYATPLGQKTLTIIPKLTLEMREAGRKWGAKLGQDSMAEVLTEHPELAKALQEAAKANRQ